MVNNNDTSIQEVTLEENTSMTPPSKNNLEKYLTRYKKPLIITISVVFLAFFSLFSVKKFTQNSITKPPPQNTPETQTVTGEPNTSPSPSPFPFQELTIPYLRSRTYNSQLGTLELINNSTSYTSYLTSYNSDGLRINGLLYIPNGEPPVDGWPAVVFVHGYIPPQEYNTLDNYNSYASYLATQGLIVFKIDLRGHGNSEGEPGGAYYSGDYIIDTLNARSAIQKLDNVNEEQIGLWGHSMAGNVVFRSLAAMPDIQKVVIWAGAVYTYEDFQNFRISDTSYQPPSEDSERQRKRQELFDTYGTFDPTSPFWAMVPATNYLDSIKGAIQIHHAINDNVVSIDYSRNLISILDDTSIEHELFEYSSGGHNLVSPIFNTAMSRSAEFLKSY